MLTSFITKQADVQFTVSGEMIGKSVVCNPIQIVQSLTNLVNNAVDAVSGHSGAWVRLNLEYGKGTTRFRIIDSGLGIAFAEQKNLFEAFFTTKRKGTGLGLSVTRRIAEAHEGSVRYELHNGNTSFVLELPNVGPNTQTFKTIPFDVAV